VRYFVRPQEIAISAIVRIAISVMIHSGLLMSP
jgi:hypothetical protein